MNKREYLFSLLMEESGEIAQAANKCNRFTPNHAYYETTNLERLQVELRDLMAVLYLLEKELGIVFDMSVDMDKLLRIKKYMKISADMGALQDGNPEEDELLFKAEGP